MPAASDAPLPIDAVADRARQVLRQHGSLELTAPPGAGKTTRLPLLLCDEPWLQGRRIVIVEPRRLAARAAARHVAGLLGEPVGGTAGYRVRLDTRVGPSTRIEFVTHGVFIRQLQSDPGLPGVGAVVFDEFHERNLDADLALALCLDAQQGLRKELRLVLMSATLDVAPAAALLGGAPVVAVDVPAYPVALCWLDKPAPQRLPEAVAATVRRALADGPGDILVFLPGARDIRRVAERLAPAPDERLAVLPLHGDLPFAAQDAALAPGAMRKIVLATAIAETSLTIPGVRIVVDSGYRRAARFDPTSGLSYTLIGNTLNVFQVALPEGAAPPFPE